MSDISDKKPIHLKWSDYQALKEWKPSRYDQGGSHLEQYPGVEATGLSGRLSLLPTGSGIHDEITPTDLILIGVQGDTQISVGSDTYRLGRYDVLRLNADTSYRCGNVGPQNALFFSLAGALPNIEGHVPGHDAGLELSSGSTGRPDESIAYLPWKEHRRKFRLAAPHAEVGGFHRAAGPWVQSGALAGHMMIHPFEQSSPWHSVPYDLIFIQLRGDVDFAAAGQNWSMKALDVMMMPANIPYSYTNVGQNDAMFFDTYAKTPSEAKNIYYASDPGWPVRVDAELLDLIRDFDIDVDH